MSMPWVHQTCNYAIEEFSCINHWAFSWNCFVLFCFIAIVKYNTTNRLKVAIQITSSKWNLHWFKHWVLLYIYMSYVHVTWCQTHCLSIFCSCTPHYIFSLPGSGRCSAPTVLQAHICQASRQGWQGPDAAQASIKTVQWPQHPRGAPGGEIFLNYFSVLAIIPPCEGGPADCRILRLWPGQPRQGRRLWPHQGIEDGRGQVPGPSGAQEGRHERLPRQHEEDEEVSITYQPRPFWNVEPQVWRGLGIIKLWKYMIKCQTGYFGFNKALILCMLCSIKFILAQQPVRDNRDKKEIPYVF